MEKNRREKLQVSVSTMLKAHRKFSEASPAQKQFERRLICLIAKENLPLRLVESPWFKLYTSALDSRVTMPGRKKLSTTLLPEISRNVREQYVNTVLENMDSCSINFDLWMSRGCEDVFDVFCHFLDGDFNQVHVHLCLFQCESTEGEQLAINFEAQIAQFPIKEKLIAHVKDGCGNLRRCTQVIEERFMHPITGSIGTFDGTCIPHILSICCNNALKYDICNGLNIVSTKTVRSKLQSCITWTKKSGKGRKEWRKACQKALLPPKVIPTPYKVRFAMVLVSLSRLLQYRKAVELCFSSQASIELRRREPSEDDWLVVQAILDVMKPVMDMVVPHQRRDFWLLSDAVAKVLQLNIMMEQKIKLLRNGRGPLLLSDVKGIYEEELRYMKHAMCEAITVGLCPITDCFYSFEESKAHMALSLCLDPRHKHLGLVRELLGEDLKLCRGLIEEYDEKILIPMILNSKESKRLMGQQSMTRTEIIAQANARPMSYDFGLFDEKETTSCLDLVKEELARFRSEPYSGRGDMSDTKESTRAALRWLKDCSGRFPRVAEVARHIFGIPPSQMDNERAFSLAGVISQLRTNRAKVELMENLMQISLNYSEEAAGSTFTSEEDFVEDEVRLEEELNEMKDIDVDNESNFL